LKKKLRIASLVMLIIAVLFVVFAFLTMDVPIDYPNWLFKALKTIYKVYPVVMIALFAASFFVKNKK